MPGARRRSLDAPGSPCLVGSDHLCRPRPEPSRCPPCSPLESPKVSTTVGPGCRNETCSHATDGSTVAPCRSTSAFCIPRRCHCPLTLQQGRLACSSQGVWVPRTHPGLGPAISQVDCGSKHAGNREEQRWNHFGRGRCRARSGELCRWPTNKPNEPPTPLTNHRPTHETVDRRNSQ